MGIEEYHFLKKTLSEVKNLENTRRRLLVDIQAGEKNISRLRNERSRLKNIDNDNIDEEKSTIQEKIRLVFDHDIARHKNAIEDLDYKEKADFKILILAFSVISFWIIISFEFDAPKGFICFGTLMILTLIGVFFMTGESLFERDQRKVRIANRIESEMSKIEHLGEEIHKLTEVNKKAVQRLSSLPGLIEAEQHVIAICNEELVDTDKLIETKMSNIAYMMPYSEFLEKE